MQLIFPKNWPRKLIRWFVWIYVLMASKSIHEEWPIKHGVTWNAGVTFWGSSPGKIGKDSVVIYPDGWGRRKRTPLNWSESQRLQQQWWWVLRFFKETSRHLELHGATDGFQCFILTGLNSMKDDNDIGKILLIVFVSYTNFAFKPQIIDTKTCHTLFSVLYLFIFTLPTCRFSCHVSSPFFDKLPQRFRFQGVAASLRVGMCFLYLCREGTGCCRCQGSQQIWIVSWRWMMSQFNWNDRNRIGWT